MCQEIKSTNLNDRLCRMSFSLGCIFRSKGGMSLQSVLSLATSTYFFLMQKSIEKIFIWILHGLWMTCNAGGLAYLPHVSKTLQMCLELIVIYI